MGQRWYFFPNKVFIDGQPRFWRRGAAEASQIRVSLHNKLKMKNEMRAWNVEIVEGLGA